MSADRDGSDRELGLTLEDLPDSLNLGLQSSPLSSGKPGEWLDGYLDLPAGATLMPDTSDHDIS